MPMIDPTDYNLNDSHEPTAAKPGEEYRLVITDVRDGQDKNGYSYVMPRLEIVGEPYSKDFTHFLHLPSAGMNEKQLNKVKWNLKAFTTCFSIDLSRPQDPKEDWVGQEGFAILGTSDNEEYGEQNFIKKLVTPQ
jgi:hypothetical protein